MSITPTNRNNPCQICEDTAGKCRQGREDESYWQCMTYADTRKGEIVNRFKCIGHTRDRLWAQFKLEPIPEILTRLPLFQEGIDIANANTLS